MPALIACHPQSFGEHGLPAALALLPGLGIRALELPIPDARDAEWDRFPLDAVSTGKDATDVRRRLEEAGLQIAGVDLTGTPPDSPEAIASLMRRIDLAAAMNCTRLIASAGFADNADERSQRANALRELGDHCRSMGAILCLQTEPGLCQDHRLMAQWMDEVAHPHVRLCFDTGHIVQYNHHIHGEVALAKVCHLVKFVRLQDANGEFGRRYSPALGCGGAVDFARVYQLMKVCGFHGPYSLSIQGIEGEPPPALDVCQQRIRDSLKQLRNVGFMD